MTHFFDSRADICQIFVGFLENLKKSKIHSEINWPLKIAEIKPERLGVAPHSMAKATDTITDSEDIVKLAKPGDYYQVRTHHIFSRILNFLFLTGFVDKRIILPFFSIGTSIDVVWY